MCQQQTYTVWLHYKLGKGPYRHCILWLPHKKSKCMVKILIGHKYYVRHLNKNIFSGSNSTTSVPILKFVCDFIHGLLNVSEDPVQCAHTILCLNNGE